MSSKEQYRDALKRSNRIIAQLKVDNHNLNMQLKNAKQAISLLKTEIENVDNKKWWQFWK